MNTRFNRPVSPRQNFLRGILCGIATLFCFFDIGRLYWLAIIFFTTSVANFFLYVRLKRREEEAERTRDKLMEGLEDEDDEEEGQRILSRRKKAKESKKNKKERKAEYNAFLENLEKELGDFDEEETEDDKEE